MTNGSCNRADSSRRCACLEASEHHTDLPVCHVTIQITERASLDSLHRLPCFFRQRLWRRSPTRGEERRITKAWCSNPPPPPKKKTRLEFGCGADGYPFHRRESAECVLFSRRECYVLSEWWRRRRRRWCALLKRCQTLPPPPPVPNSSKHHWLRDVYVA